MRYAVRRTIAGQLELVEGCKTMFKKLSALTLAILLIWVATLVMNYFFNYFRARAVAATSNPQATTDWPDPSYFYTFSVLAISLMSFMSFLYFSREVRG